LRGGGEDSLIRATGLPARLPGAAYRFYETAPLRLLAKLLAHAGDTARARALAARACASRYKVPADEELAKRLVKRRR
jgi:hypothetical protein